MSRRISLFLSLCPSLSVIVLYLVIRLIINCLSYDVHALNKYHWIWAFCNLAEVGLLNGTGRSIPSMLLLHHGNRREIITFAPDNKACYGNRE